MDLFDPKPELTKRAGQPHPDGVEIHQPGNTTILLAIPFEFRKYGQCGMDVSDALPHIAARSPTIFASSARCTPSTTIISEGLNMLLTCKIFPGRPVMGAWISYALGTENQKSAGLRGAARSHRIHDQRQAALGQRLSAGALSGRGVQHARRAGASSESAGAAAAGIAARQPRLPGQAQRRASAGSSARIGARSAHPEFRTGCAHATGGGRGPRSLQRNRSHAKSCTAWTIR